MPVASETEGFQQNPLKIRESEVAKTFRKWLGFTPKDPLADLMGTFSQLRPELDFLSGDPDADAAALQLMGGRYKGGGYTGGPAPSDAVALANKYGAAYGVDPKLLLAIAKHETGFGTLGQGRRGYDLGYGATDSGNLSQYAGRENQYRHAAAWLAKRGAGTLQGVLAGKAASYATDPRWEQGIARTYRGL